MEFQQATYQHLAAQIPATQGPWFAPAPEVHIPQEPCGSALETSRQRGRRPGLQAPAVPSAPHPETKPKDLGSFVSGHTQGPRGPLTPYPLS